MISFANLVGGLVTVWMTLFFATAVLSLRHFSHRRLEKLLGKRGQQGRLERLLEHQETLTLSCATPRAGTGRTRRRTATARLGSAFASTASNPSK